jgi:hypothetical protein
MQSAARDARGVVMAEFLVALFPVMIAFLGFTQFCFMGIAKLAVRHSAVLAARAAVVVIEEADGIPGAPVNIYGGFPAGGLEVARSEPSGGQGATGSAAKAQNEIGGVSQLASDSGSTRQTMDGLLGSYERTSTRLKQIRTAAYWPLLAISPSLVDDGMDIAGALGNGNLFPKMSVKDAIGKGDSTRILGAFMYNLGAVAVSFPTGLSSAQLRTGGEFADPNEPVTTRVTYLFRCQVPFVSAVMCASGWSLMFGDAWVDPFLIRRMVKTVGEPPTRVQDMPAWVDDWKRTQALHDQLQQRVDAFSGRKLEFDQVEWPFMLDVLLAWPGSRYIVMSAEAELPLQGAKYYPRVTTRDLQTVAKRDEQKQSQGAALPNIRETLTPIGDGVKEVAQTVSKGMNKVSEAVDKVRGLRDEYLGKLQSDAQGYVGEVKSQTSGLVGDLQGAFDQYGSEISEGAGNIGNALGEAGTNIRKQANSGANQVTGAARDFAGNVRDEAAGMGSAIKDQAKGLGGDAVKEAGRAASTITQAGNGYVQDITNAGKEGADTLRQTGRGLASELQGANPLASGKRGSSKRKPLPDGASSPEPGREPLAEPGIRSTVMGADDF